MAPDAVSEVLGLRGGGAFPPTALMLEVEKGLPLGALDRVARAVAPEDPGFAFRMVPRATLARRRKAMATARSAAAARLSSEESARVARLAAVWAMARAVWGDEAEARAFLFRPHPMLEGRRPVDVVLANEFGRPLVEGILGRLQYRLGRVTAQRLDRVLTAWRIGDPDGAYPIFDATGSKLYPGRWNTAASPVLYASEHYSTAMLEKLAHGSGRLPPNQHAIEITIPNGVGYEMLEPAQLPGWDHPGCAASKAFGEAWQRSRRSLLLMVPSVVARMERNLLLNPEHPEFPRVTHGLHRPVWWDGRLFAPPGGA